MRKLSSSGSPFEDTIGFSRACRVGPVIAVAGTASLSDSGETVHKGDAYNQTKRCLELSLKAIDELGGCTEGIVRTRIMLKDIKDWESAARAQVEIFSTIKPACTFVEVKGFINPEWLIETEVDCVV